MESDGWPSNYKSSFHAKFEKLNNFVTRRTLHLWNDAKHRRQHFVGSGEKNEKESQMHYAWVTISFILVPWCPGQGHVHLQRWHQQLPKVPHPRPGCQLWPGQPGTFIATGSNWDKSRLCVFLLQQWISDFVAVFTKLVERMWFEGTNRGIELLY